MSLSSQLPIKSIIIGLGIHGDIIDQILIMSRLQPQSFCFISAVLHPQETAEHWHVVAGYSKAAMTIDPTVSVGFAPGGLLVHSAKSFGDNAFILLLFVPQRPPGTIHHLVSADDPITAPVQETFEK